MRVEDLNEMERVVCGAAQCIIIMEKHETKESLELNTFWVNLGSVHVLFDKKGTNSFYEVCFDRHDFSHTCNFFERGK